MIPDKTNHWEENKTTRSTVMKKTSLSKSELIKMIMWFYLCELSSLVKIFCEESESGPALRRLTDDEWAWRSPVKNISDWVIREIASGGEARAQSPWNRSDTRWACETIPLAKQNKNKHIKNLLYSYSPLVTRGSVSQDWLNRVCDGSVEFDKRHREQTS